MHAHNMAMPKIVVLVAVLTFAAAGADRGISNPSLREKLGQLLLVGFRGTETYESSHVFRDVVDQGVGGVLLYERDGETRRRPRNIVSAQQVKRLVSGLQTRAKVPLFVAIDQEGGLVTRFKPAAGFLPFPAAKLQGRIPSDTLSRMVGRTARELAMAGVNVNFAPVVDLDVDTSSLAVGALQRAFGRDTTTVVRSARVFATAQRQAGVLSTLKHFPGQGSGRGDTHQGFVDVTGTWNDSELVPFAVLVREGLADMVMTTHVVNKRLDSLQPASLSRSTVGGLLRRKLSYGGVVITDDLQMEAIRTHCDLEESIALALEAGSDILLFGNSTRRNYDSALVSKVLAAMENLVTTGRISVARIDSSWRRVMDLKRRLPPRLETAPLRVLVVGSDPDSSIATKFGTGVSGDRLALGESFPRDTVVFDSALATYPDAILTKTVSDFFRTWMEGRTSRIYEASRPVLFQLSRSGRDGTSTKTPISNPVAWEPLAGQDPGRVRDVLGVLRKTVAGGALVP